MGKNGVLRRIFALIVILAMVLSCTVPAFAATSVQSRFKVDAGYMRNGTSLLAIKKDHSLWDMSSSKKITTKARDFLMLDYGVLVVKTDNSLRYYYKKSSGSWTSKKLLSGVRELAKGDGFVPAYPKVYVYLVRTSGKLTKLTLKFNSDGVTIGSKSSKNIMSKVKHAYVSCEYDDRTASYYALKTNGNLYGWGYNAHGEIANGKTGKVKLSNKKLILKNVKSLVVSGQTYGTSPVYGTSCYALKKNGKLYGWGINDFLTIQSGAGEKVKKPILLLSDVRSVDAANHVAIAVTTDDVLWTWGSQLGNYTIEGLTVHHQGIGVTPVAKNVKEAVVNQFTLFYIKNNKRLYYMGNSISEDFPTTLTPKKLSYKVTAVKTTDVYGTFFLKTSGNMYGVGFSKGSRYYSKVKKIGEGFPK